MLQNIQMQIYMQIIGNCNRNINLKDLKKNSDVKPKFNPIDITWDLSVIPFKEKHQLWEKYLSVINHPFSIFLSDPLLGRSVTEIETGYKSFVLIDSESNKKGIIRICIWQF